MKKFLALVVVVVLVAAAAALSWAKWRYENAPLATPGSPVRVVIERGASLRSAGRRLREAGVDTPDWALAIVGRLVPEASRIHAGTYQVTSPITLKALVEQLMRGDVLTSEIRFIEGWTFRQMRAAISANADLAPDAAGLDESALLAAIGATEARAEGLFFPSTYHFAVGASDLEIYRAAYRKMQEVLQAAWPARDASVPLASPYDALVLASIVEKETGVESDRVMVAGVFTNRLRINMMLQSDPTTIYGLGDSFDGNLRRRDLTTDTPWNTYTRKGLPPTPIALPGAASINAVLHPASTPALYFVARGDGSSEFSETLAAHERAVRKFQLKR